MLYRQQHRMLGLLLVLLSLQAGARDDTIYYGIGGGEPISRPPSNRVETLRLGGDVAWNTDLICGNFDMNVSVSEQLEGIQGSFQDLMGNVIQSATAAVASLPALVIQRVNPALYDLLQNGVLQASEEFHIARTSCEELVGVMDEAIGNDRWESVAKGGWWGTQSNNGGEILDTKARADTDGVDAGVVWVAGARRGGQNQPPIEPIEDAAKAGYNLLLNRAPNDTTSTVSTCDGAPICEEWASPQAFADWTVQVLGDKAIRTCAGCSKIEVQAGMGLNHSVAWLAEQIAFELGLLVSSPTPPSADELAEVSGGTSMQLTRPVIEALREEDENLQPQLIDRLAGEMALARTMERALMARRALLAGMDEPNVANVAVGREAIALEVAELEQEVDNLLYEMDVRQRVATSMPAALLSRQQLRSQVMQVEPVPQSGFRDGAVQE
jgi:integrating conjugative element protein (TIGR03755 family)